MDDSVNGKKPFPPENKPAEQNIDKNSSDEYNEDTSPKLDSRMSDALELDDSANLEQAIRKINDNGSKMDKLSYKICHTSSPISFEKNISEMHKYLEKLDQSSIYSTTSDTEMCAKEVNVSDKTPNGPSRSVLPATATKLRQELNQEMLKWRHLSDNVGGPVEHSNAFAETRDKPEASNESSKNTAHDLDLTLKRQETEKQSEDDVSAQNHSIANIKEENKHPDSTEEMNLPHGNRNKAKDESKPAFEHRIKTALFSQENLKGLTYISKASIERKMEDLQKSLDAEIKLRRKTESELKLAQGNLEELRRDKDKAENDLKRNLDELAHYKAKSQLEMEKLRNSRYDEIKERRKTESELKLAQQNLEGMRREKEKAENGPTSHDKASTQREIEDLRNNLQSAQRNLEKLCCDKDKAENELKRVALICCTLFIVGMLVLGVFCALFCHSKHELSSEIERRSKAESELKLAQKNLEGMRRDKDKAENATKDLRKVLDDKSSKFDSRMSDALELDDSALYCRKMILVPSQTAFLEAFEKRLKMVELKQESMSNKEAKMSNGANDVRAVSGTTYWSGDESSSKIGSFIEESENRQLAECRDIIENTPVLRGCLAGKTKRGLRENTEKGDISAQNRSIVNLNEENEHPDSTEEINLPHGNRNTAKDELKPVFDQRIKTALFGLAALILLGLTCFALVWIGMCLGLRNSNGMTLYKTSTQEIEELRNSLDEEIKQRRKTENGLKLAQENLKELRRDKASILQEMEGLRNNLDAEIKQRAKAEGELKLAQQNYEELRRDWENETRSAQQCWLYLTFILYPLTIITGVLMEQLGINPLNNILKFCCCLCFILSISSFIGFVVGICLGIPWYYSTLFIMGRRNRAKDESKPAFDQRIKTALFCLAALLLLVLAFFGLVWFGMCLGLRLAQENSEELGNYKASAQRQMEDLRNSLDAEIKKRRKVESELKLAQGLRRDNVKAENGLKKYSFQEHRY
ncbi:myosin-3 [Ditylenchus destructor]|uniref:Myosin-3 n=1 Tax=Ditylenchus destructor TaxID=166010 RepID=A0AAD4QUP5_9BILA|nr:myosin-3 [Ditylenchus destructor]